MLSSFKPQNCSGEGISKRLQMLAVVSKRGVDGNHHGGDSPQPAKESYDYYTILFGPAQSFFNLLFEFHLLLDP